LHVDQATFRSKANRANNYLIDRSVQKTLSFTGIDGVNVQDRAIQETMGAVVDRSKEHLGPADKAIIQLRRLLRQAVITAREGGTPAGVRSSYYRLRAAETIVPRAAAWRSLVTEGLAKEEILQTV
jgi:phthalate 4,5-dioxygenase